MADSKLSALSAADGNSADGILYYVSAGVSKKVTKQVLLSNLTSAKDIVSAAVNTVSAQLVSVSAALTSAHGAADTALSATLKADVMSAINVLSNALSADLRSAVNVASAAATSADGHANTVSTVIAGVSTLSGALSTKGLQTAINALSNKAAIASAAATSADGHAATASVAATSADGHANTVSAQLVSVSAALTSAIGVASAAATSAEAAAKSAANVVSVQVHADLVSADTVLSATLKADAVSAAAAAVSGISAAVFRGQTWVISAPTVGGVPGPKIGVNATAKQINAYTLSSGTAVTFNIENRATVGAAGTNLMAAELDASAVDTSGTINAGTSVLTAGNWLWIDISGTSGSPAAVVICLRTTQP